MTNIITECLNNNDPLIMGIVNVTPDSFSDGGKYIDSEKAILHGLKLLDDGADILDIGGESTRPNSKTISVEEEISRVIPVIKGLSGKSKYISIDTRNSKTMEKAINTGANIINDISALQHDLNSINVVSDSRIPICLMHMKGTPQTMQNSPAYDNVIDEILSFFEGRLEFFSRNNISLNKIIIDPGIGFGKSVEHNLSIIKHIDRFKTLGCPILMGASRKSFIGSLCNEPDPNKRLPASITTAIYALEHGVKIFRVHDVKETRQAFDIYKAIKFSK